MLGFCAKNDEVKNCARQYKMTKIIFILLLILPMYRLHHINEDVMDHTKLVLAFMVHRHGDRTPIEANMKYCTYKDNVLILTKQYGFGQLTDLGKYRSYTLGQFIRRRYNSLLSAQYNRSEIYIRSTDSTRAKITVLEAMAAVYPPTVNHWSPYVWWTPVPYTTVPILEDHMLSIINCPVYIEYYVNRLTIPFPKLRAKYYSLLNRISEHICQNITNTPAMMYPIYDYFVSQQHLGVPLNPELEELMPQIKRGADEAMAVVFDKKKYANLHGGVLLKQFFDTADKIIKGENEAKVHVYSAHDINVFTFTLITKITPHIEVPKYNALYSLELRKVLETGQHIVVPVYLKEPGEKEVYLQMDGCRGFCTLDRFREMTKDLVLDFKQYRTLCKFTEEYKYDTSSVQ